MGALPTQPSLVSRVVADAENISKRAVKTFVQAFVAVLLATNQPISKEVVVAAVAAGVSAVWNSVIAAKKSGV